MNTEPHRRSMTDSPVELSRGTYFQSQDEVPRHLKKIRTATIPIRGASLTDFSGPWAPQYVLSLDGGGIKGYSSLWILQRLMQHINEEEERLGPDPPQPWYNDEVPQPQPPFQPCDYFDYVFGTSTGGLIAIMLGRLRMGVDEALDAYRSLAGKVFAKPRWLSFFGIARDMYDHHELKLAIDEVVEGRENYTKPPGRSEPPELSTSSELSKALETGDHEVQELESSQPDEPRMDGMQRSFGGLLNAGPTFNSDPSMCRTVCVAYAGIEDSKEYPFLFRSYEHIENNHSWKLKSGALHAASMIDNTAEEKWWVLQRNPGPAHALPIWQVARATTAATGYFRPMTIGDIDFVDGALGCNNPTVEAYHEVMQMHNGNREAVRLLLSIGTGQSEVTRIGRGRIGRLLQAGKAAVGVLTGTEETHRTMIEIAAPIESLKYSRFNVPKALGVGEMRMDVWNDDVRQRIEDRTTRYLNGLHDNQKGAKTEDDRLKDIAKILVQARRDRASTKRWPVSTSQVRYRCTIEKCDNGQKVRNTFDEMWTHIVEDHGDHGRTLPSRVNATPAQRDTMEKIINSGQIVH